MVRACTIAARNYLAHVRVLAESFQTHHPDGHFAVLLVDDEGRQFDAGGERFQCLRLSDIGIDGKEIRRLAAIYDVTELATAVKPLLLQHLLRAGDGPVVYLDPDIRIYGSLERPSRLAAEHGIVLTPHVTVPLPADGRRVTSFHILSSGVYNLGFIAVGTGTDAFLDWWWLNTRRDALVDHSRMMFTDQRWIDLVPSLFDHYILKDPTFNVAYWNLHGRDLTWSEAGYRVNGEPLTFFHFSGFDPDKPYLLSKHQGDRPRILLSERPALARICREYLASLEHAGLRQQSLLPYGWLRLPSGIRFDRRMRRLYRDALQAYEKGTGAEPPDPFDHDGVERFLGWLNEPVSGGLHPRVSRYLDAVYRDRPDVQEAFPDLAGRDREPFFEWVRTDGVAELEIPAALLPPRQLGAGGTGYAPPSALTSGVNIAGYFRAELGIGEAARLLTAAVEAAGIPHSTVTYGATASRKAHAFDERGGGRAPYDINIVCVNADRTPDFARDAGPAFSEGRYTAGYWFWELEQFPPLMHAGFDYVDEVWAATDFVANAIRTIGRKPVYRIPLPVPIPDCSPAVTRKRLRLPDSFMFLFMFDFFSIIERKNPMGVIRAFDRAFAPGEGPVLVIKTINGDARSNDLERLRAVAPHRNDVLIVDEYYSADEKNALIGLCDCYVSLHRSEGLGLTMAEAMGLEKPVIATAYSGNLDFMTPDNSYLVNYVTVPVGKDNDPYPAGSLWAEPDIDEAASFMRRVYESRDEAARKARQGRQDILTRHDVATAAATVRQRIDQIHATKEKWIVTTATSGSRAALPPEPPGQYSTLLAALDRMSDQLTPVPSVAEGRPFRAVVMQAQRLLLKLLRPYWWQQRQIQQSLLDAVREAVQLASRAARSEPDQRQALEAVWAAVQSGAADPAFRQAVIAFQQAAERHLKNLTDEVGRVAALATTLDQRLDAAPYMADPGRFTIVDEQGRQILGFRSRRADNGDIYAGFEDVFRGPEALVRDRFRVYVPLLRTRERVVDLGCGRGELLDLLAEAGVPASGIDVDAAMVTRCREKGHAVEQVDALSFLRAQPDASLPALFSAHVVEHLKQDDLLSFLCLSRQKLQPGGLLIFETVNPHCLEAFKAFYTDRTHDSPIFPEVAIVLCWLTGFGEAYVRYPIGTGDPAVDRRTSGAYAVVATSAAG